MPCWAGGGGPGVRRDDGDGDVVAGLTGTWGLVVRLVSGVTRHADDTPGVWELLGKGGENLLRKGLWVD